MSEIQDMTTQMAKELMLGIQDSVEDLAVSFKKMAILHAEETTDHGEEPFVEAPVELPVSEPVAEEAEVPTELIDIQKKQARKKKVKVDENQLSLFDLVA